KSIQEISDYFNFPNASYFGTFFRKQTGTSPQQYRRKS
ncbi:helix-turn-helix domain-containing protein, partial [Bacteroides stercorirosoris]